MRSATIMLPLEKDQKLLTRKNLDVGFGTIMINARKVILPQPAVLY